MADTPIDETRIIAWLDGMLDDREAVRVAEAVAADPALGALAEQHRKRKARFTAAFGGMIDQRPAHPQPRPAPVISLAAVRAERQARPTAPAPVSPPRRWLPPAALAIALIVGALAGRQIAPPDGVVAGDAGIADQPGTLALAAPIARALDGQLSGEAGSIRVALSFRDQQGGYCRSFAATAIAGIACRAGDGWELRYALPGPIGAAGSEAGLAQVIGAMIAGQPLDAAAEGKARADGWR